MVMSEKAPVGWLAKELGDITQFSGGGAFKEIYQGESLGAYPFVKVSDMNLAGNERFLYKSNNWISDEIRKEAKIKLFPARSTVFAKVGAALLLNNRRQLIRETAIDNNMMAAIPSDCNHEFLYYFLQTIDLKTIVQSGAVPSVNQSQMESIPVSTPPLPEQKKIASILTSVDEVIENTQKRIGKLQDLKKATMNELLTKGIGHTEFKDNELGKIPKSWEVTFLGNLGEFSKGKGISKDDTSTRGVPCIRYAEIYTGYDYAIKRFRSFISKDKVSTTKRLKKNDIVFAGSGETVADIGKSVSFVYECEAYVGGDTIVFSPIDEVNSTFLSYQLNDDIRRIQLRKLGQGSSIVHIYSSGLKHMRVCLPPRDEQQKIVSILTSLEKIIEDKHNKFQQLQSLKKSLMQDLLTGKVKVKVN